jgi:hypothetical protein
MAVRIGGCGQDPLGDPGSVSAFGSAGQRVGGMIGSLWQGEAHGAKTEYALPRCNAISGVGARDARGRRGDRTGGRRNPDQAMSKPVFRGYRASLMPADNSGYKPSRAIRLKR